MLRDIVDRPFIAAGVAAFVLMIPLAATSTDAMIRRLGRRWGLLHRLIYLMAPLAILHYLWHKSGKNDYDEVAIYAAVVGALLGYRVWLRMRGRNGRSVKG
jgi:sulfoxide reductase heme-binding subunit YedZ